MKKVINHEPNLREISKKNRRFVLLDTSFILTCIRNKIDFIEEISFQGLKILIPKQVIQEIKGLAKPESKIALKILEKSSFNEVDLKGKKVDAGIISYSKEHNVIVATLDRELKKRVKTSKLVIRGKKKLEIV